MGPAAGQGQKAGDASEVPEEKEVVPEVWKSHRVVLIGESLREQKTKFDVNLEAVDASVKIKIIKEVRGVLGLGLKEVVQTKGNQF